MRIEASVDRAPLVPLLSPPRQCYDEYFRSAWPEPDALAGLEYAQPWHPDVQQYNVWTKLRYRFQSSLAIERDPSPPPKASVSIAMVRAASSLSSMTTTRRVTAQHRDARLRRVGHGDASRDRKVDPKRRALMKAFACRFDTAAVQLDELPGERQPYTRAWMGSPFFRLFSLGEAVEHAREHLL